MASVSRKWVYAGFDGHGSLSGVVYSKANGVPQSNVVIKFPDCSPENIVKLLYSMNHYQDEISLIDIAINIKNPAEWINTMRVIASNNKVQMFDHHITNLKYISQLKDIGVSLFQFSDTISMARALTNDDADLFNVALVGSVTDRDPSVKKVLSDNEIQRYLAIANRYDVIIRNNLQNVVSTLLGTPKEQLMQKLQELTANVEYPPEKLVSRVQLVRNYGNIHVIKFTNDNTTSPWIWKVQDYYAMVHNLDYLITITSVFDRQLNSQVPVMFVIKYWLSDMPSPLNAVKPILMNRKIIGHEDGFSVSLVNEDEGLKLAEEVANVLQSPSSTVSLLPTGTIAKAIDSDFRKILERLTQILETQQKMYEQYLELKREQVNLLKNTSEENRRRYD